MKLKQILNTVQQGLVTCGHTLTFTLDNVVSCHIADMRSFKSIYRSTYIVTTFARKSQASKMNAASLLFLNHAKY